MVVSGERSSVWSMIVSNTALRRVAAGPLPCAAAPPVRASSARPAAPAAPVIKSRLFMGKVRPQAKPKTYARACGPAKLNFVHPGCIARPDEALHRRESTAGEPPWPPPPSSNAPKGAAKPFLSDVQTLRERARNNIDSGVVTTTYQGDVDKTIDILQAVLATEIVCVLRYTQHSIAASGISSEAVRAEFKEHAAEESEHMLAVAERINQLGGTPNFDPQGLATRSASQYAGADGNLIDMIKENLIAERIAVDHYRELIRYFGDDDPTTRVMLEGILAVEEEHADDMHDLLVAHEGRPMLPRT